MKNFLFIVGYFLVTIAIMYFLFALGRKYVFSKVKINKWIPLGISIALFVLQVLFKANNPFITMGFSLVVVWFFMWFIDIQTTGGPKAKEKKIEIRPKAKPNRVKHLQKQNKK